MTENIISRAEALSRGLPSYFTGKPCKHGHVVERYTTNKHCKQCHKDNRCVNFDIECPHCQENFKPQKQNIRLNWSGYCSSDCAKEARRKNLPGSKQCQSCCEDKPISQYGVKNGLLASRFCNVCRYEKGLTRRNVSKYGVTEEEYKKLFNIQKGVCAICHRPEESRRRGGNIRRLSIDHNHKTGSVRGLLCNRCNAAIGYFREDVDFLSNAIAYLLNYSDSRDPAHYPINHGCDPTVLIN